MANSSGNGVESIRNLDNLVASGFTDSQARALLEAMSQNVATKSDVEITKLELKRDIEEVRKEIAETKSELKRDIEEVRKEIAETKSELKRDIEEVRKEIAETKSELKRDIEKVRSDLSKDIEKVRADLFIKIEQVKGELNKDLSQRMFYFFLATVTILGSLMAWMKFFVPVIVQN